MADVNLGLYSAVYASIDSAICRQATTINVKHISGLLPVDTLPLGFAGMTQGSTKAQVTIEFAVPADDLEFNPTPYMRTGAVVEFGIVVAGNQMKAKGFVTDSSLSQSTDQSTKLSIDAMCRFADFE